MNIAEDDIYELYKIIFALDEDEHYISSYFKNREYPSDKSRYLS